MSAAKKYVEARPFRIKDEPELSEQWVKDLIVKNPGLLGLGTDLQVIASERLQISGGRLDLLLRDPDTEKRYEVEVQLGRTDESHIIRTIEYWDLEQKRDPHFEHCAVIIAEEITARFFNVISLFNGRLPLIAIKMSALDVGGNITLSFTKVLEENLRSDRSDVEESPEVTRATWENNTSKEALSAVDTLVQKLKEYVGPFEIKYNKYYIGCVVGGKPANFIAFKPQKSGLRIDLGIELEASQITKLEEARIEVLPYTRHWKVHPIKLSKAMSSNPPAEFFEIVKFAFEDYFRK